MLVALVHVPAGGVGLPDLHELAPHGAALAVEHAAAHLDALADGLAVLAHREVGLELMHVPVAEGRGPQLDALRVRVRHRLGGVAEHGGAVRREVQARLGLARGLAVDGRHLLADLLLGVLGGRGVEHAGVVERVVVLLLHGVAHVGSSLFSGSGVVEAAQRCGQPVYCSARYCWPNRELTTLSSSPRTRMSSNSEASGRAWSMVVIQYEKFWAFHTRASAESE